MSGWTEEVARERGEMFALLVNANQKIDQLRAEGDQLRAENALLRRSLAMVCRQDAADRTEPV